jgi:transcriptional regulator with XRE-family HTH domain
MGNFPQWLQLELDKRGWRQADLARAANLDSAVISNLINSKRGPGEETCQSIAKAFGIPPETVYRAAGLLPPISERDERIETILHLAEQLPDVEYTDLIAYIELRIKLAHGRDVRGKKGASQAVGGVG